MMYSPRSINVSKSWPYHLLSMPTKDSARPVYVRLVPILILVGLCPAVHAQGGLDKRLFDHVYAIQAPGFEAWMRVADASVYPVLGGVPAGVWAVAWRRDDDALRRIALRITLSEAATLAATLGLKYTIRRPRPYRRYEDVVTRGSDVARIDPYSFPSAHAAFSFALATSASLSHPRWYVVGPGYAWATSVALSRVWLGVHFPGDVLAGAALGAVVATGVHLAGDALVPEAWRANPEQHTVFVLRFVL